MDASDLDYSVDIRDAIFDWNKDDPPPRYASWADARPKTLGSTRSDYRLSPAVDDETIHRLNDGPNGVVTLALYCDPVTGLVKDVQMPIRDERTGGFEGRFGSWSPSDVNVGPMSDYDDDMRDQLMNNPLGAGGPYVIRGNRVDASVFGGSWPTDSDLSISEVIAWVEARGDSQFGRVLRRIRDELNL